MSALRLGTRGSALALVQARTVAGLLAAAGHQTDLVIITTSGDRLQQAPLSEVGGKQIFVKEIDDALLAGTIDLAVHSAKDMPAVLPDGIEIAAVLPREDPRDAFILPATRGAADFQGVLDALGRAPAIGTGSIRRVAQLAALLPDASFVPIRGNVDTRVRKLDAGTLDALVLAMAGLRRLGLEARVSAPIPIEHCIPAPGQGIVAVEARAADTATRSALASIHDRDAASALAAERAVLEALGGSCRVPLGAVAEIRGGRLVMLGVVATPDGREVIRRSAEGALGEASATGRRLAEALAAGGAARILTALQAP